MRTHIDINLDEEFIFDIFRGVRAHPWGLGVAQKPKNSFKKINKCSLYQTYDQYEFGLEFFVDQGLYESEMIQFKIINLHLGRNIARKKNRSSYRLNN